MISITPRTEIITMKNGRIVKTNRLNEALHNLSLVEMRIIQLAIISARENGQGHNLEVPLAVTAEQYAKSFEVTRQTAFKVIMDAEKTLFNRQFTFYLNNGDAVKTRWVTRVQYVKNEYAIFMTLSKDFAEQITRIDGFEDFFTQYLIEQTAKLNSRYSLRLYELLVQWKSAKNTPLFELQKFRFQLGLLPDEYKLMFNFKKRVLDLAVNEINEKTDLNISYQQEKKGREIIGFKFTVLSKESLKKNDKTKINKLNNNSIKGLSEAQLGRIVRNPQFVSDYNHLISPTSPANQSDKMWEIEMIGRLRKDLSQFKTRPIRDYLK